jgi:hypothetical protein
MEGRMTLHIHVNGRQRFVSPFRAENLRETARALDEQLPILRQLGKVCVFVRDQNILHLIVTG